MDVRPVIERAPGELNAMTIARISAATILAALVLAPAPASAQVKDAVYRGTLVCGALPFLKGHLRAAMEVTINGKSAEYKQPVVNPENGTLLGTETGNGSIDGQAITLTGGYKGQQSFDATYTGTIVRRSARLTGKQVWTHQGKTYTRTCSGAVKRPFAIFLKKDGKP